MRSTYLIAGAIVLALVAAGVLFGTDFFRKNPFSPLSDDDKLVEQMSEVAGTGGFAATFSERDARNWQLADGHRLERFSLDDSGAVFARLTGNIALNIKPTTWESQGLSIPLPTSFAQQFNGQRIEVAVVARKPISNGSDDAAFVYATRQMGNSGWRPLKLTQKFELRTFLFDVPRVSEGYHAQPIIVIHSDQQGKGKAIELLGIYARVVQRGAPS